MFSVVQSKCSVRLTRAFEYRIKAEFQDSGTMSHDIEKEQKYEAGSSIHRKKRLLVVHKSKNVKCEMPVRMWNGRRTLDRGRASISLTLA